jgi:two-component system OmpR family sensor kinase
MAFPFPPRGRLFWKFFAAFWLALLVASAVVGGFVWLNAEAARPPLPRIDQGPMGRALVDAGASIARHGGRDALKTWLAESAQGSERHGPRVFAIDARGNDLLGREVPLPPAAALGAPQEPGVHLALREIVLDGEPIRLFVPAPPPHPALAPMQPPGRPDEFGRAFRLPPWSLPLATGLVASVLLAALLAWYFAKPIRALDAALKQAGTGDLAVRVEPAIGGRQDEIADLGREFDRMIRRIDALLQSQRRLLHDVSHEMRSPLARLQVCVGLARRDPAQAAAMLDRIERETLQMDALVEEILTLARLEAGAAAEAPRERTDVAELLTECVVDARLEGEARNIAITFDAGPSVFTAAHPTLLRRAFDNVVRNAIQYAPDASAIDVALVVADGTIMVTVGDRGPGLSKDDCRKIFEPFVRGSQRRGNGHGLGLAIARRAVEAHDGTIEASPREGGGLVVTIRFPVG